MAEQLASSYVGWWELGFSLQAYILGEITGEKYLQFL